jgi:hypothetical protein
MDNLKANLFVLTTNRTNNNNKTGSVC